MQLMKGKVILCVVTFLVLLLIPAACENTSPTSVTSSVPSSGGGEKELIPMGEMISSHLDVAPGTPGAASDDIVTPPGGYTYRAKVHELDKPEWPPVDEVEVSTDVLGGTLRIQYREYIETGAGEIRNNIIYLYAEDTPDLADPLDIEYFVEDLPAGIGIILGSEWYGGAAGHNERSSRTVLQLNIASSVATGEYTFYIILVYQSEEIAALPCTISVIE